MKTAELVKEWVEAEEHSKRDGKFNHRAVNYVLELHLEEKFDELWSFIKLAYKEELSEKVMSSLAAGPLEDLLANAGEKYIDEIETLARKDKKFNYLLGGVWKNTISDEIWQRVCNARNEEW